MNKTSCFYKRKIFLFIRLSLLLILGYTVLRTVLILRSEDATFAPNSTAVAESEISVIRKDSIGEPKNLLGSSIQDYSAIFERNLFGPQTLSLEEEKQSKVNNDSDSQDLTTKELGIALLGTVAGSPGISRAIIEDLKTNILSLFKVGDTVGSASIESIEKDTVVLLHEGQRKIVHLGARESRPHEVNNAESILARNPTQKVERVSQDKPPTTVAEKLRYAATMLPKAVIVPYAVDGKIEGLRITGLEKIEHLEDIGLRNGDVIRTVNGHSLASKQEAYQISMKARSQENVRIELMRDNKIETFSFHLSQVLAESRNAGQGMKTDAVGHVI